MIVLVKTSSLCEARREFNDPFFRPVIASILVGCSQSCLDYLIIVSVTLNSVLLS